MGGTLAFIHPLFPMYCGALIALIGAGLAHKYLIQSIPEISESSQNKTLKFYDSRILPFLIGWAVAFMVFTSVQIISAFYIQDQLGITEPDQVIKFTSIALLSMALTSTFMQAVVLQVLNISTETLLRICFLIFGVVLISISLVSSLTQFFLAYAGMGIAFSMITPSLNAAATLSVEPSEQGEVAGFLAGAPVVGMIFGPTIGRQRQVRPGRRRSRAAERLRQCGEFWSRLHFQSRFGRAPGRRRGPQSKRRYPASSVL